MVNNRKLKRSRDNILAGVAGGIAEFLGWEPRQVRMIWFFAGLLSGGTALIIYAICAYIFPPPDDFDINKYRAQ